MEETRICNTCGELKHLKSFPVSKKLSDGTVTRRFKCTRCTESKKVVDLEVVPVMENQIEISVPTPIYTENNKNINVVKSKKINYTFSLLESTKDKIDEIKYRKKMKNNDIVEAAINEYYEKIIKK